jgi:Protein of unknown function (DUF2934)
MHTHGESSTVKEPTASHDRLDEDTIRELAYQLWILRARPIGTPHVDWYRAEEEMRNCLRRRYLELYGSLD